MGRVKVGNAFAGRPWCLAEARSSTNWTIQEAIADKKSEEQAANSALVESVQCTGTFGHVLWAIAEQGRFFEFNSRTNFLIPKLGDLNHARNVQVERLETESGRNLWFVVNL